MTRARSRFHPPPAGPAAPPRRPAAAQRVAPPVRRGRVAVQLVPEASPVVVAGPAEHRRVLLLLGLLAIAGCAREDVVHAADEAQANAVLVALDARSIPANRRPDDGREGSWVVSVGASDAAAARRVLAEQELPRARAPGFGEVFGKPGMVPTPLEERARYLHALSGELARSVEAIDGVVEARVHLALAPDDPLRSQPPPPPRAAVLVKVRAGHRERLAGMSSGIQSLVAGAVAGLEASTVSIVLSEGAERSAAAAPASGNRRALLLWCAAALALAALISAVWPLRDRAVALLRRA